MFGLLERLGGKKRKASRARKKELAGRLERAAELYLEADLPDDAARVLLLKADSEVDPERRIVLCAQAARVGEGGEHGELARRRKAMLGFDLVKGARGATMHGELLRAAEELEQVGEWQAAAEAFALAGDTEAELRVLKEAGAIEQLERRLRQTSQRARHERNREQLLRRVRDLDTLGERREALRAAEEWLLRETDEAIQLEVDSIRSRLLAGPLIELQLRGEPHRYVLGSQVTIGRARADIVVPSSAISRQHLRLFREAGEAALEDLDTRNGSMIAGARVRSTLPVGAGVELSLAGQIPCQIKPLNSTPDAPLEVLVGGERLLVPLGPLRIGHWQVLDAHDGADRFVLLRTGQGASPPHMAGLSLGRQIELCIGDRLTEERGGPEVLVVPPQPPSAS